MVRLIIPLALILALTGCDDAGIERVERRILFSAPELAERVGEDALIVEVHGLPWPEADLAEVVGTLRMPEGPARGMRFQAVPAGEGHIGSGFRLVLRFNPSDTWNQGDDCRATSPLPVNPPGTDGFTVIASYCKNLDWQIRAVAKTGVDANDWLGYYQAMAKILGAMFPASR